MSAFGHSFGRFGRTFRFPRVNVLEISTYTVATLMVINMSIPPPNNPPPLLPFIMVTDMIAHHEHQKSKDHKKDKTECCNDSDCS